MIRLRKYRIFLAVTLFCLFAVYILSRGSPQYTTDPFTSFRKPTVSRPQDSSAPGVVDVSRPEPEKLSNFDPSGGGGQPAAAVGPEVPKAAPLPPIQLAKDKPEPPTPTENPAPKVLQQLEQSTSSSFSSSSTVEHWTAKPESFPVPSGSTIQLPTGAPTAIPRIQYKFESETATQKADRESKLDAVRASLKRTWDGYRKFAWKKDELRPFSGNFKTKFGGWAATLVDSLDTLWIAGMKEEFEEAVRASSTIDFTTADRDDIPIFETTIRYLGGFLGAYDVSGGAYEILLEKAVELADVLIGAFDTPNRMPILYYYWAGPRSSNSARASSGTVLAEIGSLSVEFTRLAQLTKNSKYYDAIARITNELDAYQDQTELPGLWPSQLDASGCGLVDADEIPDEDEGPDRRKDTTSWGVDRSSIAEGPPLYLNDEQKQQKDKSSFGDDANSMAKRQIDQDTAADHKIEDFGLDSNTKCRPVGLSSGGGAKYAIGGEADSAYEYLPKEYLLLGGLRDQYRTMYIKSAEAIKDHLLYRPMIEDEKRELLFTGKVILMSGNRGSDHPRSGILDPSMGHLNCFQGGMFAMGAKIFDRKAELDLAWKLTDACVWAYESSASGIMPEDFKPVMCSTIAECPWNQTAWWLSIDPAATTTTLAKRVVELVQNMGASVDLRTGVTPSAPPLKSDKILDKRQLDDTELVDETAPMTTTSSAYAEQTTLAGVERQLSTGTATLANDYVQQRITSEGLWPGIESITSSKYILRPEAIESVWYMFRITGDNYWRQKGWKMFEAIERATGVTYGNSAIDNVAFKEVHILDEMESFWTAETLKYFYLLFSDPSVISLDDYVLNTEAHPLLRPDAHTK